MVTPYWRSEDKWRIRAVTFALVLLTLAQVALAIWTTYWNRALFDALEERSLKHFLLQLGTFAIIFFLTIGVTALHLHAKRWLQIGWRNWLTERVLGRWLLHGHHYQLLYTPGEHDNPDGRIAEDIHIATEVAIALAHTLLYSIAILGSLVEILLSLSGAIEVPGTKIHVPGYMVVLAFAYAGTGTVLGLVFGRPLIRSTNVMQTAEANFRFGLTRVRENSESIALMHGEDFERKHASHLFTDLRKSWHRQTWAYLWIVAFSAGYGTLLPVFPILVSAPQYIAGTMTLGVLMQVALAFQKLTSALSWPIDNLGEIARCRASADRVFTLYRDLAELDQQALERRNVEFHHTEKSVLTFRDVSIANSDGRLLLENFDGEFHRGERVLIAGDAAVTSALFKTVAGLWPWAKGNIELPRQQSIVFLPQRPFLPHGTLRALLCYPAAESKYTDAQLHFALECAGVAWLTPRLDDSDIWDRVLPLRTQQRLAFARLLLQKPCWIFIEEASNALDINGEMNLMETLQHELGNA
ncbi:MAG TPA: ABC transporter ATP-binding protein/permease, partial [Spongiibacteraceae bacterium]|nr:ABC transporter ATP-binding protein/permease [Spongiibacteraceae bacterium]